LASLPAVGREEVQSEQEVERMADRGDSLEKVELVMMTEEVLDEIQRK
jgi:hypothetical protein